MAIDYDAMEQHENLEVNIGIRQERGTMQTGASFIKQSSAANRERQRQFCSI
jgi:hypothetical protein